MGFSLNMSHAHCYQFPCIKGWARAKLPEKGRKETANGRSYFVVYGSRMANVIFRCEYPFSGKVNFLLDTHNSHFPCKLQPRKCTLINFISFFVVENVFLMKLPTWWQISMWRQMIALARVLLQEYTVCAHARKRSITHVCIIFCLLRFMQISSSNQSCRRSKGTTKSNLLNSL